ncbi:MAG TPA: hypothetical protein QF353_03830 [Gammaproteobacteria bacterium]|nr:hypothetical protein [Gammaproteobacteria bacterium]
MLKISRFSQAYNLFFDMVSFRTLSVFLAGLTALDLATIVMTMIPQLLMGLPSFLYFPIGFVFTSLAATCLVLSMIPLFFNYLAFFEQLIKPIFSPLKGGTNKEGSKKGQSNSVHAYGISFLMYVTQGLSVLAILGGYFMVATHGLIFTALTILVVNFRSLLKVGIEDFANMLPKNRYETLSLSIVAGVFVPLIIMQSVLGTAMISIFVGIGFVATVIGFMAVVHKTMSCGVAILNILQIETHDIQYALEKHVSSSVEKIAEKGVNVLSYVRHKWNIFFNQRQSHEDRKELNVTELKLVQNVLDNLGGLVSVVPSKTLGIDDFIETVFDRDNQAWAARSDILDKLICWTEAAPSEKPSLNKAFYIDKGVINFLSNHLGTTEDRTFKVLDACFLLVKNKGKINNLLRKVVYASGLTQVLEELLNEEESTWENSQHLTKIVPIIISTLKEKRPDFFEVNNLPTLNPIVKKVNEDDAITPQEATQFLTDLQENLNADSRSVLSDIKKIVGRGQHTVTEDIVEVLAKLIGTGTERDEQKYRGIITTLSAFTGNDTREGIIKEYKKIQWLPLDLGENRSFLINGVQVPTEVGIILSYFLIDIYVYDFTFFSDILLQLFCLYTITLGQESKVIERFLEYTTWGGKGLIRAGVDFLQRSGHVLLSLRQQIMISFLPAYIAYRAFYNSLWLIFYPIFGVCLKFSDSLGSKVEPIISHSFDRIETLYDEVWKGLMEGNMQYINYVVCSFGVITLLLSSLLFEIHIPEVMGRVFLPTLIFMGLFYNQGLRPTGAKEIIISGKHLVDQYNHIENVNPESATRNAKSFIRGIRMFCNPEDKQSIKPSDTRREIGMGFWQIPNQLTDDTDGNNASREGFERLRQE